MNKEIKDFCDKCEITENQFYGIVPIKGNYNLSFLTSMPKGFNPTIGDSLDLSSLTSIPEGFNPTIGGWLYLNNLISIPIGFNPTVGGTLDLRSLTNIPSGFNPTVGGWLDLRKVTNIPIGFNPTVGDKVYLKIGLTCKYTKIDSYNYIFDWGKYIKIHGIFSEVISRKKNIFKLRRLGKTNIFYVVGDGNGKYSHGNTIKQAKEDLIYKITNRDVSKYNNLTLDSILTFNEVIECYRTITGACSYGTKDFVLNNIEYKKDSYTIKEIIDITKDSYGNNTFKEFFIK